MADKTCALAKWHSRRPVSLSDVGSGRLRTARSAARRLPSRRRRLLIFLEGNPAKHPLRSRAAGSSASGLAAQYAARNADVPDGAFRPVCGWTVDMPYRFGHPPRGPCGARGIAERLWADARWLRVGCRASSVCERRADLVGKQNRHPELLD